MTAIGKNLSSINDKFRIGDDIEKYRPEGEAVKVIAQSNGGKVSVFNENPDARFPNILDDPSSIIVSENSEQVVTSIEFPEFAGDTFLRAGNDGKIEFESRQGQSFKRNALDRDSNGFIDRIVLTEPNKPLVVNDIRIANAMDYQFSDPEGVRSARLIRSPSDNMSHVVKQLEPGNVKYINDSQKNEISLFLKHDPFTHFYPENATNVKLNELFLKDDSDITFRMEENGLRITVSKPNLEMWLNAPIELSLFDSNDNKLELNLETPNITQDDSSFNELQLIDSIKNVTSALNEETIRLTEDAGSGQDRLHLFDYLVDSLHKLRNQLKEEKLSREIKVHSTTY